MLWRIHFALLLWQPLWTLVILITGIFLWLQMIKQVGLIFAKYVMTIKTPTLLTKLFGQCKSLGIVKSQYEFSRLCGRQQSWYSASKCRNVQISTDAAVTLSVMIEKRAREELPEDIRPYALNLSRLLLETIKEKAEASRC